MPHIPLRHLLACLLALAVLVPGGAAQDERELGGEITIELSTGETLKGVLVAVDSQTLVIRHPVLGQLAIPRASIMPPKAEEVEVKSPWSGSFDFSLKGSRGNTQDQNARAAFNARRDTEDNIDSYALTWYLASSEVTVDNNNPPPAQKKTTDKTDDKVWGQARREWRLDTSKWRPFVQLTAERDEFKDYDYRVTPAVGTGHPIIERENQELMGRIGLAATRDYGCDENDDWDLEALVAADYRLDIDKTQRLVAGVEVYPALENHPGHRSIARAQYEAQLGAVETPWRLKLGVERFYDSDPAEGDTKMDITYFMGLGYTF